MRPVHLLLAVLIAAIWGGNFVSVKIGMQQFPPIYITALRFALVAAIMLPFASLPRGRKMSFIVRLSMLGTGHFTLGLMGLWMGLDVATAIIVSQLAVPISCLFGAVLLKDRLGLWRSGGILVAFAGIVVIAGNQDVQANIKGFMLALLGATVWAYSNIFIKKMPDIEVRSMLAWTALFSTPQLLLLSWMFEGNQTAHLFEMTQVTAITLFYTAVLTTIMAHGAWYYLLHRYPVTYVMPFGLLVPVFGIAFGQLFFDEPLTLRILLGGALTILGVAIIVFRRPRLAMASEY